MANGFHGAQEEWKLLEAPLLRIDSQLEKFSADRELKLSKNYHNWPERSLEWYRGSVRNLIQIFVESSEIRTYTLWICASEDREDKRYWKQRNLMKAARFEQIEQDLGRLLDEAKFELDAWSPDEFGFATKLGAPKQSSAEKSERSSKGPKLEASS